MALRNPEKYIREIDTIIENRLSESTFSVKQLANIAGCSRMSLYRNVKQCTGRSPSQYILQKRLWKSTEMITQTNEPIKKIATKIGFATPGYFSKKFKEEFGCSPTQYESQTKS